MDFYLSGKTIDEVEGAVGGEEEIEMQEKPLTEEEHQLLIKAGR